MTDLSCAAIDATLPASRTRMRGRGSPTNRSGVDELAIAAAVFVAYWFGRLLTRDSERLASRNAGRVIDLERSLGGFTEMHLQRWAIDVPGVVGVLDRYYVWVHFPVTIAFLIWVFASHRPAYATIRTWFAVVTLAGLAIHVAFPLAPPRMTPGFVDTLDTFGPDIYSDDTSRSIANQFAAMPSLHFAWALMVSIGLRRLTRRRSRLWALHPIITLFAIVVTGNHYWIDAAVAGLLVMAAVSLWPVADHRVPRDVDDGGESDTRADQVGRGTSPSQPDSPTIVPADRDVAPGEPLRLASSERAVDTRSPHPTESTHLEGATSS